MAEHRMLGQGEECVCPGEKTQKIEPGHEQGEEGTFTVKRVAEEMGDWLHTWVLIKNTQLY